MHRITPDPASPQHKDTLFVLWNSKRGQHGFHPRADVEVWRDHYREEAERLERVADRLNPLAAATYTQRARAARRTHDRLVRLLATRPTPGNRVFG